MPRTRADELAATATLEPVARRRGRPRVSPLRVFAAMPTDVKALVIGSALVMVAGLGWLAFGPRRPSSTPALLGWVDPGPPPAPRPTPTPTPPLKLPWWK
jgi:hypothetical protein